MNSAEEVHNLIKKCQIETLQMFCVEKHIPNLLKNSMLSLEPNIDQHL